MDHTRRRLLVAAAGTSLFAGCIGDDDNHTDDDGMDPGNDDGNGGMDDDDHGDDADEQPTQATVQLVETEDFEDILVGPDDLTLYMFDSDEQEADESTCYDDCAENWPPLIDDDPVAGDGVDAELTTFEREDGDVQVAANGWPLYYWVADEEPRDVNGQGVNDVWWVLDGGGEPIRDEDDGQPGNGDEEEDDDDSPSPGY